MLLKQLLSVLDCQEINGPAEMVISGLTTDSRVVEKGCLFICLKGEHFDGHSFAAQAVSKGAAAVLTERPVAIPGGGATVVRVNSTDKALAPLGALYYGRPSQRLKVYAVVGTNGKTTSTYLLKSVFEQAGHRTGIIGTIRYVIGEEEIPAMNTTPNALDIQRLLYKMTEKGLTHVAMEVSSHAIKLGRIDHCYFTGGIFTNITRDHLDFHTTFEDYLNVKAGFFTNLPASGWSAINLDDPRSPDFIRASSSKVATYSKQRKADVYATDYKVGLDGVHYLLHASTGVMPIDMGLRGEFNISNSLGVAALALHAEGIPLELVKRGLESVALVSGRMENVPVDADFIVLVDYAHTDDALENLLHSVRKFAPRRIITVFGCGGDRDRTKRPLMGKVAVKLSDCVFVTSDNPRTEDPARILEDIRTGIDEIGYKNYAVIQDRRAAIYAAVAEAKKDDVVVIAGKGHETVQKFADISVHFDDREVAREAVEELKK
ncbi:MAG: UDP-N-acetylmuramoyl-L-alanyl-D-glutamate--2,6-diaminopimelate ligase [Bacillota bacterium]